MKRGDGGPMIAERKIQDGWRWKPSDRSSGSRVNGKLELHKRFTINERTDEPTLKIFNNCTHLLRTLPLLPVDKNNPEDVDPNFEDHA